jgi:acetoin utilization protein AcuB
MDAERLRCLPVVDNGRLVGIVTDRDLRAHRSDQKSTRVSAAMTSNPVTIGPDASIEEATSAILQRKVGGLPVVENGRLVGVITTTDLLKALLDVLRGTSKS